MSVKTVLCQIRRADNPFYAEAADLRIFSVEELCFFIDHNLALIDEDFFDGNLTDWLREQLGMQSLAQRIEEIRQRDNEETDTEKGGEEKAPEEDRQEKLSKIEELIYTVNAELDWLYVPDRDGFRREVEEIGRLSGSARLQKKADTFVSCGKYMRAIETYKKLLKGEESDPVPDGKAWHNMGVAYARLFQFTEARDCMKKAWELLQSDDAKRDYLICVRLADGGDAYRNLAEEQKAGTEMTEQIDRAFDSIQPAVRPENTDAALSRWVQEYHHETGQ